MVIIQSSTKISETSVSIDARVVEADPNKSLAERYTDHKARRSQDTPSSTNG